nr:hypothetical protein [Tanacetum cinerariifolium]
MDMTIDQQVALDEALVPHISRIRIGKSNFRLRSDINTKELTLQVVYDVLRLTLFFKAFLVTADVPEIYMQEFWATVIVHHHLIRFKMNNKKCIVNLEYFREMLHICPRFPSQTFDELPFEEEILAFLRYLGHSGEIKKITDTFDELPFEEEILAFLRYLGHSGEIKKITDYSYDSLRLSQAQILWGMYHKKNVDFAHLLLEDFVYQVEHKDAKKSSEMYYPRFPKFIINFFMTKDPSIPRRNKVNWHYVRDDQMFRKIKIVSRHQNTQKCGSMLPVELTNEDIKNSTAYKEYYAITLGAAPPRTKASVRKTQSCSDTTMPPPTATSTRLSTSAKGKQRAKSSKAKGLSVLSEVALTEAEQMKLATKKPATNSHLSSQWICDEDDDNDVDDQSDAAADDDDDDDQEDEDEQDDDDQDDNDDDQDSDNDGDDFVHLKLSTLDEEAKDEESFDHIVQTPSQVENSNVESQFMNVGGEEGPDAEDDDEELYRGVNINLEGRDIQMTDVHTTQVLEDTHVTLTLVNPDGQQQSSSVSSQFVTSMLNPSHNTYIDSLFESTHQVDVPVTIIVVPLLVTAPTLDPPSIPIISQTDRLQDEAQAENEDFLNKLDENIHKIIKEQVKEYRDTFTLKRRRDDEDKDDEPSAGTDRGSKRRRVAFFMNQLKVDTLTPELLAGPTYKLMKGSCKSLVELKFFLEEVYKATTDQLDWNNPKGQQYLHNLVKPLPLIPNSQGVKSYQKKLNLTKPDTYRSDLKRKEAYTAYSNPRGFIYQNKDKQNKLMRIDELHKFSDDTLNDVRTALDDRLKGIRMKTLKDGELALMCDKMFPEESDEIEKYVGGLPDMIHGSVLASKPKTMSDAIDFTIELMDQKIRTLVEF